MPPPSTTGSSSIINNSTSPFWEVRNTIFCPFANLIFGRYQHEWTSTHRFWLPIFKLNLKLILPHHSLDTTHHLFSHSFSSSLPCLVLNISYLGCHDWPNSDLHIVPLWLLPVIDKWVNRWARGCPWGGSMGDARMESAWWYQYWQGILLVSIFVWIFFAKKNKSALKQPKNQKLLITKEIKLYYDLRSPPPDCIQYRPFVAIRLWSYSCEDITNLLMFFKRAAATGTCEVQN